MDEAHGTPRNNRIMLAGLGLVVLLIAAAGLLLFRAIHPSVGLMEGHQTLTFERDKPAKPLTEDQSAIAAVKRRYEPGSRMYHMTADPRPEWSAEKFSYCVDPAASCWLVLASTPVMSMSGAQSVGALWIVDLKTGKVWPKNVEARMLFATLPDTSTGAPAPETVSHWTARSKTAETTTGDIESTPTSMTIAGNRLPVLLVRRLAYDELVDAAGLFSRDLTDETLGGLYRVTAPAATPIPEANAMCGAKETAWIIAMITRVNGPDYGQELQLAAFSGTEQPDLKPAVLAKSKTLCGTYGYQKSAGGVKP